MVVGEYRAGGLGGCVNRYLVETLKIVACMIKHNI